MTTQKMLLDGKKVLVTGGLGFIGSEFIRLLERETSADIVNVDVLTYAGDRRRLDGHGGSNLYIQDVADLRAMKNVFELERPDYVVHFAAESHVDRSIEDSTAFVRTNVLGTQVLLEMSRRMEVKRFLQVSTDEVYGDLGPDAPSSKEEDPIQPSSPYSASKAAADLLALSFVRTHGLDVVVTRCSNNYGPWQHPEKLVPLMATRAIKGGRLPVYGTGKNVRDWIHVSDHCLGILMALRGGEKGRVYNFGGASERDNLTVVRTILAAVNADLGLIEFVEDRKGHDFRYSIDFSRATRELGWKPSFGFEWGIYNTVKWYKENEWWWKKES
jgi:dTDP-glucose 4,6-dehydratase